MKKQRAGRTPSVANRTRSSVGTKRKASTLTAETSVLTPVDVHSEEEISDMGLESSAKRVKKEIDVHPDFSGRFAEKAIGSRTILLGKPVRGSFLEDSGALALFSKIGMSEFLTDLPVLCYPELVREFYSNLHVDDKKKYVSFVSRIKITMNSVLLGVVLGIDTAGYVSIYSKKNPFNLDDFSPINQLGMIRGIEGLSEFSAPTTAQVLPMAHLLFRVCISNICPRLGSKSNFSGQDVSVVAMLMAGKGFDLCGLILDNMMEVFSGSNSAGLPYGLLLTKVFEFFGVSLDEEENVSAKDWLDAKGFGQSGLLLDKDGKLTQKELPSPSPKLGEMPTVLVKPVSEEEFRAFMTEVRESAREVRASVKKLEADNKEINRKLDVLAGTLNLQDVTPDQLDAIVKAAAQMLQGSDQDSPIRTSAPGVPAAPVSKTVEVAPVSKTVEVAPVSTTVEDAD